MKKKKEGKFIIHSLSYIYNIQKETYFGIKKKQAAYIKRHTESIFIKCWQCVKFVVITVCYWKQRIMVFSIIAG